MKKALSLCTFLALLGGCATMPYQPYAREVKKKPQEGGLIALHTEFKPEDHSKAESLMAANCGPDMNVKVTEEGEVQVGEKTNSNAHKTNDTERRNSGFALGGLSFGKPTTVPTENTNTSSETVALKEWQIAYNCVAMNAPAAAPTASVHKRKKALASTTETAPAPATAQ